MAKKNKKTPKSKLTSQDIKAGKNNVYIIMGMVIIGLAIAFYRLM